MRKVIAVAGLILFAFSLLTIKMLGRQELAALALYDQKTSYGSIVSDIMPCTWEPARPEIVIPENKTAVVLINTASSKDEECESIITIEAPGFETSPSKDTQTINLPPGKTGSISWILTPGKTGTYQISVSDSLNTKIYGITVNNVFGLSAIQAKIASYAGSIFGPMLTLPWWLERFRRKKSEEKPEKPPEQKTP